MAGKGGRGVGFASQLRMRKRLVAGSNSNSVIAMAGRYEGNEELGSLKKWGRVESGG